MTLTNRPIRVGDIIARVCDASMVVHLATCTEQHRWETCPKTPNVFAVGDALDAMDLHLGAPHIAAALHSRMCTDAFCGPKAAATHAADEPYTTIADALIAWQDAEAETGIPQPHESYRRLCACGHISRGHSPDGLRCYHTPCTCGVDGGFRPTGEVAP